MDTPQTLLARIQTNALTIQADAETIALMLPSAPVVPYPKAITDRIVRPKPARPSLGPAGFIFPDPTFGQRILRVTDDKSMGGSSFRTPSTGRCWAADSRTFVLTTTGGTNRSFKLNPDSMQASMLIDAPLETEPDFGDAGVLAYGRVSRNVGGANPAPTVAAWEAVAGTVKDVVQLQTLLPSSVNLLNPRTYARGIAVRNNVLIALFGGQSQDDDHYVLCAGLSADGLSLDQNKIRVLDTLNDARIPSTKLHFAGIDLTGRYVWLGPSSASMAANPKVIPAYLWDTQAGTITPVTTENGGHGAAGFACGINSPDDNDGAETLFRDYLTVNSVRELITPYPKPTNFQISNHMSWWNAKPGALLPVFVGNYRYYGNNLIAWREWDDEIVAIETRVGPTVVYRFCHHRSNIASDVNPNGNYGYWYLPKPQVSPDGKWCLFTSNWEKTLGADAGAAAWEGNSFRQDAFLVELT
jgi:hypothetical protein